jgi:hypothetical protein
MTSRLLRPVAATSAEAPMGSVRAILPSTTKTAVWVFWPRARRAGTWI